MTLFRIHYLSPSLPLSLSLSLCLCLSLPLPLSLFRAGQFSEAVEFFEDRKGKTLSVQGIADFTEFSAKDDVHSLRERGRKGEREREGEERGREGGENT